MVKLSVLQKVMNQQNELLGYWFICPGCKAASMGGAHYIPVNPNKNSLGAGWNFDGNEEKPTFTPSVLGKAKYGDDQKEQRCHLFVKVGQIQYLSDCDHEFAGQTVPMVKIEEV